MRRLFRGAESGLTRHALRWAVRRGDWAVVAATGWLVGRFTWREVRHAPTSTARRLAALVETARRLPFDAVHVAAIRYDLHLSACRSLKAKRAVVRPIVEGLLRRHHVSAAEVGLHDQWQRAIIGVSAVSGSYRHLCEVLDACDRFVWSHPEVEVLSAERSWLDGEG